MRKLAKFVALATILMGSYSYADANPKFTKLAQCDEATIDIRRNYYTEGVTQVVITIESPELKKLIKEAIRPFMERVAERYGPDALNYSGNVLWFYLSNGRSLEQFNASTMNYGGAPDYDVTRIGERLMVKGQFFAHEFSNCRNIQK